jgi:signal transduction histidine kinase
MDHLERLVSQLRNYLFFVVIGSNFIIILIGVILSSLLHLDLAVVILSVVLAAFIIAGVIAVFSAEYISKPVQLIWQAVLHVSPGHTGIQAPNLEKTGKLGRELVTTLALQVYQLASGVSARPAASSDMLGPQNIMNSLPLPLFVIGKDQAIIYANEAAQKYLGVSTADITHQNMYSLLDFSFPTEDTFDAWLAQSRAQTVTASKSWEHVRLKLGENRPIKLLDMAAYYNKDNPHGIESIIALFDHTTTYAADDQAMSFVALAVHELRTPLTLLRGYIEVFEEELDGKLDAELAGFMDKMQASAQQLSAFVNNILNVARIEADQLVLQLREEQWEDIVRSAGKDLSLRAQIHNKSIVYNIAVNLPAVAVDRVSIYEVLSNLLDNAIKYSGEGQQIVIRSSLGKDGLIETTVSDKGVGIPANVLPHLFEKFYRNHRTQSQVGGTGLGLYLSKAIIEAHGGNIWINAKEGEGTAVSFTLQPYVMVAHKLKGSDNRDIVRSAHGWIKNHSLYRR